MIVRIKTKTTIERIGHKICRPRIFVWDDIQRKINRLLLKSSVVASNVQNASKDRPNRSNPIQDNMNFQSEFY